MTNDNQGDAHSMNEFEVPEVPRKDRLTMLKDKARLMGIPFSPNIGEDKLAEKIKEVEEGSKPKLTKEEEDTGLYNDEPTAPVRMSKNELRAHKRKEALKLVRVLIVPMDPLRVQLEGEMITGGNSLVGSIAKYVHFNTENGYHIPQIILEILKERKYVHHYTVKNSKDQDVNRHKLMPAYNITILDPLTQSQIDRLGADQRGRANSADYQEV